MENQDNKKNISDGYQISYKRQMRTFKVIVVGDCNVGKTCLTYRFCEGKFPLNVESTIGVDFREKIVNIDGESIRMQFWDTAGQERFRKCMTHHYYRNTHAVVFVYDMTKLSSFENLKLWVDECDVYDLTHDRVSRILVGNKCDAVPSACFGVTRCMALQFADAHQMPLFETSAFKDSEMDHVNAIFLTLAHKLKYSKVLLLSSLPTDVVNVEQRQESDASTDYCVC